MVTTEDKIKTALAEPIILVVALCLIGWTALIAYSLYWNIENINTATYNLALSEAQANWNKDAAFRRWATSHGGVYVKPTKKTPPNPYLAHLKHRDITTTDGTKLTLMNPAYMMREMTTSFEKLFKVKGSITGKIQLNPINKPDPWELKTLNKFEADRSIKSVNKQADINGEPFLRFMKPMYMTEGCVKCHGHLGFKDGDLRGGVSVSIPMTPYLATASTSIDGMKFTHGIVWLLGTTGFLVFYGFMAHRQKERRVLLSKLEHNALYDALTSLPNRILFSDRLNQTIFKKQRNKDHQFAVCFLDLDRFKNINDSFGHDYGDDILCEVSKRLELAIRNADSVARNSGDEFTILLDDVAGMDETLTVATRILDSIQEPFYIKNKTFSIDASIGIYICNEEIPDADNIIRNADMAMYRAKLQGKGRIEIYNQQQHDDLKNTTSLEHDIGQAVNQNQLEVYYQPVFNARDGEVEGFEALLRWTHPEKGMIPPDKFIPIAESTGAIIDIGKWVLDQACQQVSIWNKTYKPKRLFSIAVNFSSNQIINDSIINDVSGILKKYELSPNLLHCELTETMLMLNRDAAKANLKNLRDMGIKIHADDFGKGYSSLTYLHDFNFDTLKIDKDFVNDMKPGAKGEKLTKTLLRLAEDMNLSVVAEGVETQEQYDQLTELNCESMQGYLLSPPLPVAGIEEIIMIDGHTSLRKLIDYTASKKLKLVS